jgi:hypothetical protein
LGIEVIDVRAGHELVLDEHRRRRREAPQQIWNEVVAALSWTSMSAQALFAWTFSRTSPLSIPITAIATTARTIRRTMRIVGAL